MRVHDIESITKVNIEQRAFIRQLFRQIFRYYCDIFSISAKIFIFIVTFGADLLWQSQRKCWIIIEQRANKRSFLFLGKLSEAIYNFHYLLVGFYNDSHHLFGDAVKASVYADFSYIIHRHAWRKIFEKKNHMKWLCCVPSKRRKKSSFLLSNSHVGKQKKEVKTKEAHKNKHFNSSVFFRPLKFSEKRKDDKNPVKTQ